MVETDTELLATVEQLTHLVTAVDTAQSGIDDLHSTVEETIGQIEAEWSVLEQRASTMLALVTSAQNELIAEAQTVEQTLSDLQESIEEQQQQAHADYTTVETYIDTCDEKLGAQQEILTGLAQSASDSLSALQAQAETTEADLTEAITHSANTLQTALINDLSEHSTGMQRQVATLESCFTETCMPLLSEQVSDFTGQLDTVVTNLTGKLEQIGQTTTEKTIEALLPLEEVKAQYELITNNVTQLKQSVDTVVDRMDNVTDETARALSLLEDGVEVTSTGALMVVGILEDVRDLLA